VLRPESAFDALILDLRMPGMRGAESVLEVTRRARGSPVLVCTALDDPGLLWRLDKAGVFAVVNKAAGSQEFLQHLRAMLENTAPAPEPRPSARSTRPAPLTALAPMAGSALLTPRQRDILKLVHEGKPSKVIASQLGIGLGTVKSHLHALYAAMGVTSRTEAVALSQDWML
jgi:DNA-binding NarL/FixJ family response regulator